MVSGHSRVSRYIYCYRGLQILQVLEQMFHASVLVCNLGLVKWKPQAKCLLDAARCIVLE